jgi:hypothetical protein
MLSLILAAFMGALIGAFVYQCLSLLVRHARRPRLEFEIRSEAPLLSRQCTMKLLVRCLSDNELT